MLRSPTAGPKHSSRHIGTGALLAAPDDTALMLRQRIASERPAGWELICIVDERQRLLGTLTAQALLALPDDARLGTAARRGGPRVSPHTGQEHMCSIALHHGVVTMPVVDDQGRFAGIVGSAALMDILRREHVEDLHRLAGITQESQQAIHALEAPPLRRARHRLPWLVVGLFGSMVATLVVSRFESALAAMPTLAFFVPALVYLADAVGTQSEAVAVRGLSLSHARLGRLIGGELRTGALIGLVLALLAAPAVWLAYGNLRLASAVSIALASAIVVASMLGLLLPWLLERLGTDPAYGSGPVATIVQDVLSLLIYFGCVTLIVL